MKIILSDSPNMLKCMKLLPTVSHSSLDQIKKKSKSQFVTVASLIP